MSMVCYLMVVGCKVWCSYDLSPRSPIRNRSDLRQQSSGENYNCQARPTSGYKDSRSSYCTRRLRQQTDWHLATKAKNFKGSCKGHQSQKWMPTHFTGYFLSSNIVSSGCLK